MAMDSNISSIASKFISNIKEITNVSDAVYSGESLPIVQEMESPLMEKALESDFYSPSELVAKKAMSAAIIIAKRKGLLPESMPENINGLGAATIADDAFTRMKTAFHVASGKLDAYEAADKLIDHATARALAISDAVVEKGIDMAVSKIGIVVAASFPPLIPVVVALNAFQPAITEKAQKLVKQGIVKMNTVAKESVRKIVEAVETFAHRTISTTIKRLVFG